MNEVRRLAKRQCANFHDDATCLDPTIASEKCLFFLADCEGVRCRYFEQAVLPTDTVLQIAYFRERDGEEIEPENLGECAKCGKSYRRHSNRQKYCSVCRVEVTREAARNRQRLQRGKKKSK